MYVAVVTVCSAGTVMTCVDSTAACLCRDQIVIRSYIVQSLVVGMTITLFPAVEWTGDYLSDSLMWNHNLFFGLGVYMLEKYNMSFDEQFLLYAHDLLVDCTVFAVCNVNCWSLYRCRAATVWSRLQRAWLSHWSASLVIHVLMLDRYVLYLRRMLIYCRHFCHTVHSVIT